jgi:hypothetical protein
MLLMYFFYTYFMSLVLAWSWLLNTSGKHGAALLKSNILFRLKNLHFYLNRLLVQKRASSYLYLNYLTSAHV